MRCAAVGFGSRIPSRLKVERLNVGVIEIRDVPAEFGAEIEQLKAEMRELEVLMRQNNSEVERLQQKQAEAAARLRQVDANFDSFSREQIKEAFVAERDAQLKLLMMRSQLELFESKQRYLDRYIQQLRHLSELSARLAEETLPPANGSAGAAGSPSETEATIQTIEAQELERQRLAQQMHDGPAQSLTNLILQAEIVERMFERDPQRARAELTSLKTSAGVTFQRVREFIFALRPMMLDDLGLVPTLRRYVQTFEKTQQLPVMLTLNGNRTLPSYLEVTIFRAVQELLNNVVRHANASRAQVAIDLDANPISISVEDDGAGYDASEVLARARARGGSGLVTLTKRVEMLGGNISYQSTAERGTRVRLHIPSP